MGPQIKSQWSALGGNGVPLETTVPFWRPLWLLDLAGALDEKPMGPWSDPRHNLIAKAPFGDHRDPWSKLWPQVRNRPGPHSEQDFQVTIPAGMVAPKANLETTGPFEEYFTVLKGPFQQIFAKSDEFCFFFRGSYHGAHKPPPPFGQILSTK